MGSPDREFTWFPKESEQADLREGEAVMIARYFRHQPKMGGRFMHELLRNDREGVCYDGLRIAAPNGNEIGIIVDDIVQSAVKMQTQYAIPEPDAKQFITTSMNLLCRAVNSIPLSLELDEHTSQTIKSITDQVIQRVDNQIRGTQTQ